MLNMAHESQDGLEWEHTLFNIIPHWTREPSISAIEKVSRQELEIPPEDPCHVSFYASGAFNKLYRVDYAGQSSLMRVTLPVYPHHKTHGEVTTLRWLGDNTSVPVPKVLAFDDSRDNEIGFEWILMELMPGLSAYQRWRMMTMEQKQLMVKRMAEIQAELFYYGKLYLAFKDIGTLHTHTAEEVADMPTAVTPGTIVAHEFFIGDRVKYDVPRGPFHSSHDWLESLLKVVILEQKAAFEKAEDDEDREGAEEVIATARRLLSIFPRIFPEAQEIAAQPTVLWHDDLNLRNILVDEKGDITAIVDWECVTTVPVWMTANMPKFLQGTSRSEEPTRNWYADETPSELAASVNGDDPLQLDNEGKCSSYWRHRMEYEVTQLREVYKKRLTELWPEWPSQNDTVKANFYEVVIQCSDGLFTRMINKWIDRFESGKMIGWDELLEEVQQPVIYGQESSEPQPDSALDAN
ncbi:phosphotransferase enzyme family-domain-containing protein [Xylaria bambusicola]|uniref:phosphotransferase enzyme family-domain-containing protein n=1 Tax=Xylaria bambusicola TaxID=326684 RepID=UPI0020083570|nr:phosphotransferase enzyme family-domain-containing protein [Xylaria bambusicola]KAI0521638.1 phosphotransferase enzyme family-domain-containing protein [Xylaria bambusicola]